MVWEIHQSSTSTPCFRLTKLEPLTQHSGSGLARLRQWWSLFISNLRACGATGSSVFWETQILSRLWGFLKIGDRGYHCVYIYIYISIHEIYVPEKQMELVELSNSNLLFFLLSSVITFTNRGWISTRGGWKKNPGLRKTGSEIPYVLGKDLPRVPTFFFWESSNHNPKGPWFFYTSLGGKFQNFRDFKVAFGLNEWKTTSTFQTVGVILLERNPTCGQWMNYITSPYIGSVENGIVFNR